jgi:hypothetical protein
MAVSRLASGDREQSMKLIEIKQYVFNYLQVKDTKQLKRERTDLV